MAKRARYCVSKMAEFISDEKLEEGRGLDRGRERETERSHRYGVMPAELVSVSYGILVGTAIDLGFRPNLDETKNENFKTQT